MSELNIAQVGRVCVTVADTDRAIDFYVEKLGFEKVVDVPMGDAMRWVEVTDAHVLGSTTVRGRPAWRVSFYDQGTPGWFTVLVDKTSLRIYQVRMTATAHFMRDDYGSFNTTPAILPPR